MRRYTFCSWLETSQGCSQLFWVHQASCEPPNLSGLDSCLSQAICCCVWLQDLRHTCSSCGPAVLHLGVDTIQSHRSRPTIHAAIQRTSAISSPLGMVGFHMATQYHQQNLSKLTNSDLVDPAIQVFPEGAYHPCFLQARSHLHQGRKKHWRQTLHKI